MTDARKAYKIRVFSVSQKLASPLAEERQPRRAWINTTDRRRVIARVSYIWSPAGRSGANICSDMLIPVQAAHHNEMMSPAVTE
jgi:hypothetical protein